MPYIRSTDAVAHEIHGARFVSYANAAGGAKDLRAWRGEIPGGTVGVPHTVTHEEVLYLLTGALRFTVDGDVAELAAGDAVVVPAGAELTVDNVSGETATAWVCTTTGLGATLRDGSTLAPPWAN